MFLVLLSWSVCIGAPVATLERAVFKAVPFGLGEVKLTAGSRLQKQAVANTNWLLSLNEERLMCLVSMWCAVSNRERERERTHERASKYGGSAAAAFGPCTSVSNCVSVCISRCLFPGSC